MRGGRLGEGEGLADDRANPPRLVIHEEIEHLAAEEVDPLPEVAEIDADHRLVVVHEADGVEPREGEQPRERPEVARLHPGCRARQPEADEASYRSEDAGAVEE